MGLFDFPVKSIFPLVAQVAPFLGPVGAPISFAAGTIANADARQTQNKKIIDQQQRNQQMSFDPRFSDFGGGTAPFNPPQRQATNNAGFGSGFGNFLSDLGNNILSPISGLFGQIRPMITQQSQGQPALPTQSLSEVKKAKHLELAKLLLAVRVI
jgi:hypothetical protein